MTAAPLILFPDVEATLARYVRAALKARPEAYAADVFVGNGVAPPVRRERMVMIRNDGSTRLDVARSEYAVGLNVWGATDAQALDLARLVAAIVWAAPDGAPLIRADGPRGPYSVAEESEQPRYYMTFSVILRADQEGA